MCAGAQNTRPSPSTAFLTGSLPWCGQPSCPWDMMGTAFTGGICAGEGHTVAKVLTRPVVHWLVDRGYEAWHVMYFPILAGCWEKNVQIRDLSQAAQCVNFHRGRNSQIRQMRRPTEKEVLALGRMFGLALA